MRKEKNDTKAAKLAWDLFTKTGSVSYYMLYHELSDKNFRR